MTLFYQVSDFQNIFHQFESNCKLDNDVLSIFQYLEKNIIIPNENDFVYPTTSTTTMKKTDWDEDRRLSSPRKPMNKRGGIPRVTSRDSNVIHSAQEWIDMKNFKATPIQKTEGMDKELNNIRIMLNKLSSKNYDTMKENIIKSVRNTL